MQLRRTGRKALLISALLVGLGGFPLTARAADAEDAQYNAVVVLYNAGQWQAALAKIEEREKLDISEAAHSKYLYAKGLALEKGKKVDDAREAYEQLIEKYPKAAEVNASRVKLLYIDYYKHDDTSVVAAYAKVDLATLTAGDKRDLAFMNAESLYALKKDDKATLAAYKTALALGADSKAATPKLFDLYQRLGMNTELLALTPPGSTVPGMAADVVAVVRAEALLAMGRFAEADTEAQKVTDASDLYPRASFVRAQALIKQNKLKEATAPLKVAVSGLKDPPAPPAAYVALAECLAESGQNDELPKAIERAEHAVRDLPQADQDRLKGQIALLRLRAVGNDDPKKLIEAVDAARDSVTKEQLPKLLYMQLFARSSEGDRKAILRSMEKDYPVLQTGAEDGPATLIYFNALKQADRADEAGKMLDEFLKRKPQAAEAAKAHLLLAGLALEKGDNAAARTQYDALQANPQAAAQLGKNPFDEAMFNRAIVLQKLGDQAGAAKAMEALVAAKPDAAIMTRILPLLGQAYAVQKNYARAAAAWKQALSTGKVEDELDLRDRLARVLLASGDQAGAIEQCAAAANLAGNEEKLSRELREVWARALFAGGKFTDAAARYQSLADSFHDAPAYAYECGVAFERAGQLSEAAKWYANAQDHKDHLPADYAAAIDARLAAVQLKSGNGEESLPFWFDQIANPKDEAAFQGAVAAIRNVGAEHGLESKSRERLNDLVVALPADQPRHYTLGALQVEILVAGKKSKEASELADHLAADFSVNEKKLDPKSPGATIAPAMIFFFKGEAQRHASQFADALATYETVLSVYPYNEWPDAAMCGEAECLLGLGDRDGAVNKFKEVIAATASAPASARWRELATRRVAELSQPAGTVPAPGTAANAVGNTTPVTTAKK